jgi:myo-inositol catabolism protein IolH
MFSLLGGRRVFHYDHQAAWSQSVKELEPVLERHRVKMGFLPHPGDFMEESDAAVDLIKSIGCRQLGYVYVLPHTFVLAGKMDADPAAMIRYAAQAGVLTEVHMADSLRPAQMWIRDHFDTQPNHSHLVPGRGGVDIKGALNELVRQKFEGPILMIPYRYGVSDRSFAELAGESKEIVEKMLDGVEPGKKPRTSLS